MLLLLLLLLLEFGVERGVEGGLRAGSWVGAPLPLLCRCSPSCAVSRNTTCLRVLSATAANPCHSCPQSSPLNRHIHSIIDCEHLKQRCKVYMYMYMYMHVSFSSCDDVCASIAITHCWQHNVPRVGLGGEGRVGQKWGRGGPEMGAGVGRRSGGGVWPRVGAVAWRGMGCGCEGRA